MAAIVLLPFSTLLPLNLVDERWVVQLHRAKRSVQQAIRVRYCGYSLQRERAGTRLTRALNSADPSSSKKKRQCGNLAEPREFSQALLVPMHRGREGVAATREELGVRWLLPVLKVLQVVDERLLLEVSMLGQDCIRRPD